MNKHTPAAKTVPISRFPVPKLKDMPPDIRARIEAVQEKSGFIPNVFLVLAHRPEEFRAFMAYHDTLMDKAEGLTKAEREMIVVATSAANQCQYCVIAHGAILRIRAKNPLVADQIAVNYRKADITPRQRAMLDFAMKVALEAHTVGDDDVKALKKQVSATTRSGISAPSRPSSRFRTAWPISLPCGRTTSSTRWGGRHFSFSPSGRGEREVWVPLFAYVTSGRRPSRASRVCRGAEAAVPQRAAARVRHVRPAPERQGARRQRAAGPSDRARDARRRRQSSTGSASAEGGRPDSRAP